LVSVNMDKEKLTRQKEIQTLEKKDFELSKLKYNEGVIAKLDLNQREENLSAFCTVHRKDRQYRRNH